MSGERRILLLGATGQVGKELQRSFLGSGELICRGRETADLANASQLVEAVR